MNTCRFCKDLIKSDELAIRKPSCPRFVVHASCGIRKLGKQFIDEWVRDWQLGLLPAIAISETGLLPYVQQLYKTKDIAKEIA